jgi:hypothetical protein
MDYILSLQRIAMARVESESYEDSMRRIRRWYSKTYFVPIKEVEEMTDEEVLVEYFEHAYEEMTPEERKDKIKELAETPEEKQERLRYEKEFEDRLMADMKKDLDKIMAKRAGLPLPQPKLPPVPKKEKKEAEVAISFEEGSLEDLKDWD